MLHLYHIKKNTRDRSVEGLVVEKYLDGCVKILSLGRNQVPFLGIFRQP